MVPTVDKNHNPARNADETHEEYRSRRRNSNQAIRWYLSSKFGEQLRWLSRFQGPYRKEEGPLLNPDQATALLREINQRAGPQSASPLPDEEANSSQFAPPVDQSGEALSEPPMTKP